jgi:hypothetical protein
MAAEAADRICDHCGCNACCYKVCVPKRIEKEITKICWDYKCEDICIPGRSTCCDVVCKEDKCGCWSYRIWDPTCGRIKTRKVPVKVEVKRKVPAIEWVVENRCAGCCHSGGGAAAAIPPAAPATSDPPPAPPAQAAPPTK